MAVTSTLNRVSYTADGVLTSFAYPFEIFLNTDLQVFVAGVLKTLTTDYTVSGVGSPTGGNVTFTSAPANGAAVIFIRVLPITQLSELPANDPFPSTTVETALDKLTLLAQQLNEVDQRTLKLAVTSLFQNLTSPDPVAGRFLRWNAGLTGLENATIAALGALGLPVSIADGGTGAITAVAARAALNLDGQVPKDLTNRTGGASAVGDVVTLSTANDSSVVLGDTVSSKATFVFADAVISDLSSGRYILSGVVSAKSTGTIGRGEYVRKSATTKAIEGTGTTMNATNDPPQGALGVALAPAGGGFCLIYSFGKTFPGTTAVVVTNDRASFRSLRVFNDVDDLAQRIRIVADEVVLRDPTTGDPKRFTAVDVTADLGDSGAGGLDTGSIAASTEYDAYLIGKSDGTISAVWSKGLQWTKDQDYADSNRDATLALRDATARTRIAQGFQVAASATLHSVEVSLIKVSAPTGTLWAEIQTNNAGVPSNTMVTGGRSMPIPVDDLDPTNRLRMRFVFPQRPSLTSGTQYHVVLKGDFTIGANYVTVGVDASSPAYANGAVSTFDGTSWAADATRDFALFTVNTLVGTEAVTFPTGYTFAGRVSWNRTNGSSLLMRFMQQDDYWQKLDRTDIAVSGATWVAYDLAGVVPAAWAKEYELVGETNGGNITAVADPLPLGPATITTVQTKWHSAVAGNGVGRMYGKHRIPGWTGPMVWLYTSAASNIEPTAARLLL